MSESHKGKPKDFSKISDADRKRRSDQMKAMRAKQKLEKERLRLSEEQNI
jgi:hypothetical protein